MKIRRIIVLIMFMITALNMTGLVSSQESIFGALPFPPITPRNVPDIEQLATLGAGTIQTVAWSHDGEMLAVGTSIGVWIYDAPFENNGRYLLTGSNDSIAKAIFSPDDNRVATISRDQNIALWDVATGRRLFSNSHGGVQDVAFNSDGSALVTVGLDSNLIFWNMEDGRADSVNGLGVSLSAVVFNSDDTQIYVGDTNGDVHAWDIATEEEATSRPAHEGGVYTISLSPDGNSVVTGGDDGVIRVWTADLVDLQDFIRGSSRVRYAAFGGDANTVMSVSRANTPQIWDMSTGNLAQTFDGHEAVVVSAAFSPDASRVISGSTDGTVRIWNASTGEQEMLFSGYTGSLNQVAISPTLTHVVAGSNSGVIKAWELNNLASVHDLVGHFGPVSAMAFSPDGRLMASGGEDRTIRLWDMETLGANAQDTSSANVTPDTSDATSEDAEATDFGSTTDTTEEDTVEVVSSEAAAAVEVLNVTSSVTALTFTPDGRRLISAGADGVIMTWNPETGEQISVYNTRLEDIVNIAFTDEEGIYAAISANGEVETWNHESGERTNNFASGHARSIISPNNLILIYVIGTDVQLVELSTQVWLRDLRGHTADINNVVFSEDGTLIATCSDDGTVRIWAVPQQS